MPRDLHHCISTVIKMEKLNKEKGKQIQINLEEKEKKRMTYFFKSGGKDLDFIFSASLLSSKVINLAISSGDFENGGTPSTI